MHPFLIVVVKVPEHACIRHSGLRVALVRAIEGRELGWIANKEDGEVIANKVPISFFSLEFESETPNVTGGIGTTFFASYGRKASQDLRLFADFAERSCRAPIGDIVSAFKLAPRPSSLSMDGSDCRQWRD